MNLLVSITLFSGNFSSPAKYSLIFPDFIDLHIKRASLVGCFSAILLLFFDPSLVSFSILRQVFHSHVNCLQQRRTVVLLTIQAQIYRFNLYSTY